MADIPRAGYHKCDNMPHGKFIEKQLKQWHIHDKNESHSDSRINLPTPICPYCNGQLFEFDAE